jgi:hypothetical protein
MDTFSTIPLETLQDLVGNVTAPPTPFHYEKGLIDLNPPPTISKLHNRHQTRKMREIVINTQCQGDTGANVGATHDK